MSGAVQDSAERLPLKVDRYEADNCGGWRQLGHVRAFVALRSRMIDLEERLADMKNPEAS